MNLDFFQNLIKHNINNTKEDLRKLDNIEEVELQLAQKLDAIEIYTIDRFEEDIAILENNETKEIKNVIKKYLPYDIKEGTVLKCINGKYFLDKESEEEISNRIEEKMNKLWNN